MTSSWSLSLFNYQDDARSDKHKAVYKFISIYIHKIICKNGVINKEGQLSGDDIYPASV